MKHRYIFLLAIALFVAAMAFAAVPALGEKTAMPGTAGQGAQGQGNAPASAPAAQPLPRERMPAATSPAVKTPGTGGAAEPTGMPTGMATAKASPTMMPAGKPTMKATPAPAGKATTGGARIGGPAGGVSGGYVINVIEYGLVTTTISPGGVITGYVVIQNNGNDVINDAIVHISVLQANAGGTTVTTRDQPLSNLNIAPGSQKRVEFSVSVPGSIAPGSYDVRANVEANGQQVQSFTRTVTVT